MLKRTLTVVAVLLFVSVIVVPAMAWDQRGAPTVQHRGDAVPSDLAVFTLRAPAYVLPGQEFEVQAFVKNVKDVRGFNITLATGGTVIALDKGSGDENHLFAGIPSHQVANLAKARLIGATKDGSTVQVEALDREHPLGAFLGSFTVKAGAQLGELAIAFNLDKTFLRDSNKDAIAYKVVKSQTRVVEQLPSDPSSVRTSP